MSSLKDFKNIADEQMKDIEVSDELKQKTLSKLNNTKDSFLKIAIVPAACVMVLAVSISLWNIIIKTPSNDKISNNNIQNANILNAPGNSTNTSKSTISGSLNSLEEANKFLGDAKLAPSYLPKDTKLVDIHGVSFNNENRKSVWIQYAIENRTFVVSIEQNSEWKSFEGYKDVDIDGAKGHMKAFKNGTSEITELRWFIGKSLYSIEGEIAEEEALKTARSLK